MERKSIQEKKKKVEKLVDLIKGYKIVGVIDIENIKARQLQKIRNALPKDTKIKVEKKKIIEFAFDALKEKGLDKLKEYLKGMPALILSNSDPFYVSKMLDKNKASGFAKPGQIAEEDVIIPAGPTNFTAGPIIGELAQVGIRGKVEDGKIVIVQDTCVVKKGEEINKKVAEVLMKFGIEPVKIRLKMLACYDNGRIYKADELHVSEEEEIERIKQAHSFAFNLSINCKILTKETREILLRNAAMDARKLALGACIISKDTYEEIISLAFSQMLMLASKIHVINKEALSDELNELVVEKGFKEIFG
ncbi:MAG: 50S ribosomal protein L10 [Candidatus Parvarchaeota archaeon]|nr:50S ribosomal protein L10 [Candidatus Jingweiarchaeum tengchongense]MCW1297761.1 50S ribosomal protein L10 [Candidatus Jingweiarchaeum tengchongense]MCW1299771.1 50S ribosomal protein L10 [Candidatus Jingweiarchaeum tengchongense]MCW1304258.1 50S ribosomal protein L10 [Candidatus Jingweiarchaeum tengchongense]MCW1305286.1 50S ribosomal protein L10 [Candidatus Jingweiarchaeum tengchongense]